MSEDRALRSILKHFNVSAGELYLDGRTLRSVSDDVGTPFFIYDLSVAQEKYNSLRNALPEGVETYYAVKANPHREVVSFFVGLGVGFDVSSERELDFVLDAGANPDKVAFAGPGKSEGEISRAVAAGIGSLNVESVAELDLADRLAASKGTRLDVCLRLNPNLNVRGRGLRLGGEASQFGIDQEAIPEILRGFDRWRHLDFRGFHVYAAAQILDANVFHPMFEQVLDAICELLPICPAKVAKVNLGGGFGIPYYAHEEELDIVKVGHFLSESIDTRRKWLQEIRFCVESGRYLVGECGIYVCKVRYRKESRGETFLIVDGGMHHHLAASGNFGQVVRRNYPIAVLGKIGHDPVEEVNIVGPLCTPMDRLGSQVALPRADVGDLVAIFSSGAYGLSASPMYFLGHPEPAEVIVKTDIHSGVPSPSGA